MYLSEYTLHWGLQPKLKFPSSCVLTGVLDTNTYMHHTYMHDLRFHVLNYPSAHHFSINQRQSLYSCRDQSATYGTTHIPLQYTGPYLSLMQQANKRLYSSVTADAWAAMFIVRGLLGQPMRSLSCILLHAAQTPCLVSPGLSFAQ